MVLRWITFFVLMILCLPLVNGQSLIEKQVFFASDKHQLTAEAKLELNDLIDLKKNAVDYTFEIKGHTDQDGSHQYNERLSEKRSAAVERYLRKQGIQADRISKSFYGERELVDINDSDQAKASNRRVEIELTYKTISSTEEMYEHFADKRKQQFTIQLDKETQLEAKDGTIVRIPENAFIHPNGISLEGKTVDFLIEEAIRPSTMIFNQLNTVHGENALTTGGMIRLTASVEGVPLQLKDGKAMEVFIPTDAPNPNMNLYSGSRDEAGLMEWDELEEDVNIVDAEYVDRGPIPFPKDILIAFDNFEVEVPENPGKIKDLPLPALLKKPLPLTPKMQKPYKPGEPKQQIARKPKGLFAKMKYDEAKEQEKLDEQYNKRLEQYEQRLVEYTEAMKLYKENAKVYNAELAEIDKQYAIDNAVVIAKRKEMIEEYFNRCYAFEAAIRLKNDIADFTKDLNKETIYDKLYPEERKLPSYYFNYSLIAADYMAKGEQMPRWEDAYYGEYRMNVDIALDRLMATLGYRQAYFDVKRKYKNWQTECALRTKQESHAEYAHLTNQIQYYGFKITQPNPFWCNVDTPLPPFNDLLVFENSGFVDLFTFSPQRKMVNYFPVGMKKSALYPSREAVNYIAFQFKGDQVQLAEGTTKAIGRTKVYLDFKESNLEAVEAAILAMDM